MSIRRKYHFKNCFTSTFFLASGPLPVQPPGAAGYLLTSLRPSSRASSIIAASFSAGPIRLPQWITRPTSVIHRPVPAMPACPACISS